MAHPPSLLTAIAALLLLGACYAQGGAPTNYSPEQWEMRALEACERGDTRAYKTLIRRAGSEPSHDTCPPDDDVS